MIYSDDAIETAMWKAVEARLPERAYRGVALTRAILARSRAYTVGGEPLSGHSDLAGRAVFFTVADAPKILVPAGELHTRGAMPPGPTIRVADVGAGVGALTLGLLGFVVEHTDLRLDVTAVDRDREALDLFHAALGELPAAWRQRIELTIRVADAAQFAQGVQPDYDMVLCGNLLNEMSPSAAQDVLFRGHRALTSHGSLIVIEPALRDSSRQLHSLRDTMLAEHHAHVFAPCTRDCAPCPALQREADWCHEDRPVQLSERAAKLAQVTGLRKHRLKFSYLVLRKTPLSLAPDATDSRRALRVVSQPRRLKGAFECFACGPSGLHKLRLQKRHRGTNNEAFRRAKRGDVIVVGPTDDIGDAAVELLELSPTK